MKPSLKALEAARKANWPDTVSPEALTAAYAIDFAQSGTMQSKIEIGIERCTHCQKLSDHFVNKFCIDCVKRGVCSSCGGVNSGAPTYPVCGFCDIDNRGVPYASR